MTASRRQNENRRKSLRLKTHIGKEKLIVPLCADDMSYYVEDPKHIPKNP